MSKYVIINPDRRPSGLSVRCRNWESLCESNNADTEVVAAPITLNFKTVIKNLKYVKKIFTGHMALETLFVNWEQIFDDLKSIQSRSKITKIITLTQRAFNPKLTSFDAPIILDYVDLLSLSYKQRSKIEKSILKKIEFKILSVQSKRFESSNKDMTTFITNPNEARKVGARFFPNLIYFNPNEIRHENVGYRWDVIFVGSLDYQPNIQAVREMANSIIPGIRNRYPNLTVCIAGRRPTQEVKNLCKTMNAELIQDFEQLVDVLGASKLAISPVYIATGLQNKLLEAAALKVPQLVSSNLLNPFEGIKGFISAKDNEQFIDKAVEILNDYSKYKLQAEKLHDQIVKTYSPEKYAYILNDETKHE